MDINSVPTAAPQPVKPPTPPADRTERAPKPVRAAKPPAAVETPPPPSSDTVRVTLDFDKASKRVIASFVDPHTGQVIDQIPSEKLLKLAAAMREIVGPLVDTEA